MAQALDPATRILVVRHAHVPGNDANDPSYAYTGCMTDDHLTEKGRDEARKLAVRVLCLRVDGRLGPISTLYTSPAKRACETIAPLGKLVDLTPQIRPELREIYWGVADGKRVSDMKDQWGAKEKEVQSKYPKRTERWEHLPVFPKAEKFNAVLQRSLAELCALGEKHKGETIVVVTHGRVIKTLIADALNKEDGIPYPQNCGIAEFHYSNGQVQFKEVIKDQLTSRL